MAPPFSIEQDSEYVIIKISDSYGDNYEFGGKIKTSKKRGEMAICGIELKLGKDTYSQLVRFVYGDSKRWQDILEERSKPAGSSAGDIYYFIHRGIKGSMDRFLFEFIICLSW